MRFDTYSFPHPVLGRGDDIDGDPDFTAEIEDEDDEKFVVSLQYRVDNHDIECLIAEGKATFLCEISCSATLFRTVVTGGDYKQVFYINKNYVRDNVEFLFLVVAVEPILGYANSKTHPELAGIQSDIDIGDVLAFLGAQGFEAGIAFKNIKAASTILEIVEGAQTSGNFEVLLDSAKIQVRLPKDDYARYSMPEIARNSQLASIFHSSIALPTLVYALQQHDEHADRSWARAVLWRVENELEAKGMSLEPEKHLEIAQELLGAPVGRMLSDISSLLSRSYDEE